MILMIFFLNFKFTWELIHKLHSNIVEIMISLEWSGYHDTQTQTINLQKYWSKFENFVKPTSLIWTCKQSVFTYEMNRIKTTNLQQNDQWKIILVLLTLCVLTYVLNVKSNSNDWWIEQRTKNCIRRVRVFRRISSSCPIETVRRYLAL